MDKEFIPYDLALEIKELGFNEECIATYRHDGDFNIVEQNGLSWNIKTNLNVHCAAPLYQQAFRWFREKYKFTYSIGKTNIAVVHYLGTTQLLQDNATYEDAELATIKWFIDAAKQK
jgi:hypothetical protein